MFAIPFHSDATVLNTRPPTHDASSAVGGEGSIRSGRAGSIASSQTGSTGAYSYTARALQEQQQLMANRIMMGGSSWDSAEDVIVSLKFLQPFVKAGEADAVLVANSIPNSRAGSGGDFAFTHPNPFAGGGSDEPPKTASSHATSVASSKRSTGSTSLTAMESEVYGILKMYVENKLKKKRGGKEKRMIEVGKKIEVLEDEFPDCATYIKLFKRVREIHDLPPRETPQCLEPETLQQNENGQSGLQRDRHPSSASFIDPFESLPRTAPRYTHHHTVSTSSSLSRQVSPAASVSLGAVARPPTRKLSKRGKGQGHESKPSTSSYSSQSSFSPSITADDIFVNFGLNEVDPGSTSMVNSANTNQEAGKRPSMSLFTTFGNTQKKRSETVDAEISWPLPSPTTAGKMTSEQEQAEVVKAKIAEAFLEGVPGRERKVSALGDAPWAASRSMPVRPPRPGLPATSAGGHRSEPGRTSSSQVSGTIKMEHKDDIDVRGNIMAKATVEPNSRPSSGSSSNRVLRSVASASAIRIDQPAVVSDTFEAGQQRNHCRIGLGIPGFIGVMSRTIAENDPVEWSSVAVSSCSKPIRKIVNGCHYFVVTGYSAKKGARKCWSSDLFNVGGYKWVIRFYQNGLEENSIYTSVSLGLASNGTDVEALFECALVDQSGKGRHCIRTDFNVPGKADPKGNIIMCKGMACFYDFIIRSTLENPKYLKNDCLLLHCKVGVVKKNCVPLSDMGLAFKSMFECQVGCDIAFHVKDETFKAHKVVLAARSPVFMALFYPPDGDLNLDMVVIEDVLPSIFKAMITFMYSDELPDVHRIASSSSCSSDIIIRHLMMAAEQYGMERLKLLCEAKLGKEIAADTVSSSQNLPSTKHGLKCGRKLKCIRGRPSTATGGAALLPEAQVYMSEICCNQFNRLDLAVKGTRSTEK